MCNAYLTGKFALKSLRYILTLLALLVLLVLFVRASWKGAAATAPQNAAPSAARPIGVDELVFMIQSKIAIGAMSSLRDNAALQAQTKTAADFLQRSLISTLQSTLRKQSSQDLVEPAIRFFIRDQALFAAYIEQSELSTKLFDLVKTSPNNTPAELRLDELLQTSIFSSNNSPQPINQDQKNFAQQQLGWFAELVEVITAKKLTNAAPEQELHLSCRKTWRRFEALCVIAFILAVLALVSLLVFVVALVRGRIQRKFERSLVPAQSLLEIFVLYLLAMKCSSYLIQILSKYGIVFNVLAANCFLISGLMILTLWPLLAGNSLRSTFASLGLLPRSGFVLDILRAPFICLAAWIPLGFVLVLYGLAAQASGIDLSKGAHPVVLLLLGGTDLMTRVLICVLAVVIAPIVEETMFRGAFYGWLRNFMPAYGAIFLSAFVFAIIHPQGLLGVVPLTAIGMVLAAIREWRHALFMSMCVHACLNGGVLFLVIFFLSSN